MPIDLSSPDNETITVLFGDQELQCELVTKKDRLLCPVEGCNCRYENERGIRSHVSQKHDLRATITKRCTHCNETFVITDGVPQEYCSPECAKCNPNIGRNKVKW